MIVFYINVLVIIALGALISVSDNPKRLAVVCMCYLAFLTMFRGHNIGIDTPTYCFVFGQIAELSWDGFLAYVTNTGTEPGFIFWCWLLSRISKDPQILLIMCGLWSYISLTIFFLRYSKDLRMTIYMFFTLGGFDFFLSGLRQSMSISILLFAYYTWEKGKKLPTALLIALAISFHYSSIVIIPIFLLLTVKNDKKYNRISISSVLFILVFFNPLLSFVLRFFPKYNYYYQGQLFNSEANLAVFLKMAVFLMIYIVGKYVVKEKGNRLSPDNKLERMSFLIPLIYLVSFNARALARAAVYLWPFSYVNYSNQIKAIEIGNRRVLIILSLVFFFIYAFVLQYFKTPDWQNTYPFYFCWSQQ